MKPFAAACLRYTGASWRKYGVFQAPRQQLRTANLSKVDQRNLQFLKHMDAELGQLQGRDWARQLSTREEWADKGCQAAGKIGVVQNQRACSPPGHYTLQILAPRCQSALVCKLDGQDRFG